MYLVDKQTYKLFVWFENLLLHHNHNLGVIQSLYYSPVKHFWLRYNAPTTEKLEFNYVIIRKILPLCGINPVFNGRMFWNLAMIIHDVNELKLDIQCLWPCFCRASGFLRFVYCDDVYALKIRNAVLKLFFFFKSIYIQNN